jgi:hypothetical protein
VSLVLKRDQTAQNVNQVYGSSVHTAMRCNRARVKRGFKRQTAGRWTGRDLRETVDGKMPKVVLRKRGTYSYWWWGQCALLKRRSTSTRLHGAKSQKAVIFNTTKNHRQGSPSPYRDSKYTQTLNFNLAAWEPEISHLTAMLTPSAHIQWLVSTGDLRIFSYDHVFWTCAEDVLFKSWHC